MARAKLNEELSGICTRLWSMDENRLEPGEDYAINLQGGTKRYWKRDQASEPLFTFVSPSALQKPTYKTFIALLDNYEKETKVPETVTPQEERENWAFIEAVMDTKVMKEAHSFLASKRKAQSDERSFKKLLYKIWFQLYRRTRDTSHADSSGFEHVFVGETRSPGEGKPNVVLGFHNWLQFYLQEKTGNVDYRGYLMNREPEGPHSRFLTIQFSWKKENKPEGSTFIGTSPEFEVALYTLVYLLGNHGDNYLEVDKYSINIKCYHHGGNMGTSFPIELD
eukprot:m.306723 g.306723  ORF g.306723 m.306723 type:complete len:280 (+) comp41532_c0_seq1:1357-2196(+)